MLHDLPSNELLPEEFLDRHALRDWVWSALEELSEPLQLVVLLHYFSGISSYDRIAALCDVPVGTVCSRLNQARLQLGTALLTSANLAHDDAAARATRRRREVAELFSTAERGAFGAALAAAWSPELALIGPQGQQSSGRDALVRFMESDLEAGVRQRPVDVTASRRFTIIEAELLSPAWDPQHCPPGVVWLLTMCDDRVVRVRLFHPRTTASSTV